MKNWTVDPKTFKTYLIRRNIELLAAGLVLLFAISMFLGRIPNKQVLKLDNGKMIYNGQVVANKLSGHGKLTFENGDTYEGDFKNGAFHGKGTFMSKEGWSYVGEFKKGVADGQGKLITEANVVYEGRFKQGIYKDEN